MPLLPQAFGCRADLERTSGFQHSTRTDRSVGIGGRGLTGMLTLALEPGLGVESVASNPEDFITYKLGYRCKHCGKQWTRLSVKAVGVPESYVENEEEKTDYDADKEEEEAREEEYDREE